MPHTIVFVGDSITDAGRREPARAPLGSGYVALLAPALMSRGWRVVNAGIAGDRIRDVASRWRVDVEEATPSVISLLVGINDVWRRYSDADPTTPIEFEAAYRSVLEQPGSREIQWVLCEPFLLPIREGQDQWFEDLDGKRDVVRTLAKEFGATLVPLHDEFTADAATLGADPITTDGVHLTPLGYERLALHWTTHAGALLDL